MRTKLKYLLHLLTISMLFLAHPSVSLLYGSNLPATTPLSLSLYFASNFIIIRVCLPSFSRDKTQIGGAMVSRFYLDNYDSADDVYGLRGERQDRNQSISV